MFLSVAQAATMLGVHELTVRRRVWSGELPYYRIGGRVVIDRDELLRTFRREPEK